jgi:hypothetical protein
VGDLVEDLLRVLALLHALITVQQTIPHAAACDLAFRHGALRCASGARVTDN